MLRSQLPDHVRTMFLKEYGVWSIRVSPEARHRVIVAAKGALGLGLRELRDRLAGTAVLDIGTEPEMRWLRARLIERGVRPEDLELLAV